MSASDARLDPQAYAYSLAIPTRWLDNDMHGHVNNVHYYSFFDTVVTTWLVCQAGHDVRTESLIGLCVSSRCDFHAPISYPEVVAARMRAGRIGTTSVLYEIGLFSSDCSACFATGDFVHVYVDRATRSPQPLTPALRTSLTGILRNP